MIQNVAVIASIHPAADFPRLYSLVLTMMHMHFRPGEIRQATGVVEVHVGQYDVAHIFRLIAQLWDLSNGSFLWVQRHDGDQFECLQNKGCVDVISSAQAGIHQHQTIIALDQQAQGSGLPVTGETCIAGEAIELVNDHFSIILEFEAMEIDKKDSGTKPLSFQFDTNAGRLIRSLPRLRLLRLPRLCR